MKKSIITTMLFGMACLCGMAQQETKDTSAVAVPDEARMLQLAGELVKYGYDKGEALPLIQAVEIYQNFGEGNFESEKTNKNEEVASKNSKVSFDLKEIIADAKELAQGDSNLLALIDGLEHKTTRGATEDYAVHRDVVSANKTDEYSVRFRGGEQAIVVVSGDGDTDLDLYVYNSSGDLVAKDADYSDDCVVSWYPSRTQTYTIRIVNRGNIANVYRMAVN